MSGADLPAGRPRRQIPVGKIILFCVAFHLVFGLLAGLWIVERSMAGRKLTFQAPPGGPPAPAQAVEHQISMTRRNQTMSAPAQARRIVSTGLARITLPDMPSMPSTDELTPDKMAGMGGMGTGLMGGGGGGGGGGNGRGLTMFGLPAANQGLEGHFYDLKQNQNRQPNGMTIPEYSRVIRTFVGSGWHETDFSSRFFRAPTTLYTGQVFTPEIPTDEGPAAFGVSKDVKPNLWVALYRGMVRAPEAGVYHFVGAGDDIMFVRFNGQNVLDRCFDMQYGQHLPPLVAPTANYLYDWNIPDPHYPYIPNGFARGPAVEVAAGEYYSIEILCGDQAGGYCGAAVLIEEEGVQYQKDPKGNPILPIFRVSDQRLVPPPRGSSNYPPYMPNGPIWEARPPSTLPQDDSDSDSLFQH